MGASDDLTQKRCVPCEGGIPPLNDAQIQEFLPKVPGWQVRDLRLTRRFEHEDFLGSMAFVQKLATLAEAEGHHPDFCVHYQRVDVSIWTHAINGLSDNDFILAAKINAL
jgi:4a-hydroxytetrahydrobiopterin dehydratase